MSLLKYASESQLNIKQIFCYHLLETLLPSTNFGMVAVSLIHSVHIHECSSTSTSVQSAMGFSSNSGGLEVLAFKTQQ